MLGYMMIPAYSFELINVWMSLQISFLQRFKLGKGRLIGETLFKCNISNTEKKLAERFSGFISDDNISPNDFKNRIKQ